ncbi:glycosyltransferase family 1 protein [Fulvivirgaceae bacterium BMA10]|uniref:Glycosyltransferase family 1 protein n=1 Tax=Splendidivirga corallicola TaxID=3051826 RepID=A0ABT8KIW6_9BACT|nr:glycosyltransferase family 1 protein [Fulvivirgaceae bacterium BMA10]
MRIGIEAQRLFRKKKHGMDIVALELIKGLQKIDKENEYVIFAKAGPDQCVIEPTENFEIVTTSNYPYPIWEQLILPNYAKQKEIDILHCTSNTAPLYRNMPAILTLHDVIFLNSDRSVWNQGSLYQKLGNIYRRWIVPKVIHKCQAIITVSNWAKQEILDHFSNVNDRLFRVYNGVNEVYKQGANSQDLEMAKRKYDLPDKFILFLGNKASKKNMIGVLKAYCIYTSNNCFGHIPLVVTDVERDYLMHILKGIGCEEISECIHTVGYVKNSDLQFIYSRAIIFLYPSLTEGFGLPILESMACKTPVITSGTTSMPEIAGDSALLVDPYDPGDIAEKIIELLSDKTLYDKLVERGIERIEQFSFLNMSKEILELYKKTGEQLQLSA